jgi:tetratricopeptide (TPR) repeat protein
MGKELDDTTYNRVTELCRLGDRLQEKQQYPEALKHYRSAWELLPDPKEDWEAATWIQTAIGDARWQSRQYREAIDVLSVAVRCPGGLGNPFIHLRLGEAQFELGDIKRAKDELTRAYMGAGRKIFEGDDSKYFELLRDTLIPPTGQDTL